MVNIKYFNYGHWRGICVPEYEIMENDKMRVFEILIDADNTDNKYIGWWSCSGEFKAKITCDKNDTYLGALSDAIKSAERFSKDNNIFFICDRGSV